MKSISIVAVASLLTFAYATPVEKRELVVHTVIEEVTETVDTTTTIWVKPSDGAHANYQLPKSVAPKHQHHHQSHKPKPVTTPTSTSIPSVAPVPTTPSSTSTSSTTSSSTSVYVPPYTPPVVPTTSVSIPPVVPETTAAPVVPVPEPTTQAPVPVPEPTTQAPVPVPSTPSTSPSESGSSGGSCGEIGGGCSGDITYYEAGLGACGWTNDGTTEDVFALAHGMMGEQSNGNPFCGRMATIKVPGKPTVTAKLVDKCMGCEGESIDLSTHLFNQLCDEATGRLHNVEWSFTS